MEIIDKDNWKIWWKNKLKNKELFEVVEKWKWKELSQLLEWYFSIEKHLWDYDYLINNVGKYDETLSKMINFSHTSFMEEKIWRVADNGQFEEYCWAHLRNLLSPFKNIITIIRHFSEWNIKEDIFKSFLKNFEQTFQENKKMFLEFCEFLKDEDK
jgi:hypothetical protein